MLAVGFLLVALSSIELTPDVPSREAARRAAVAENAVVTEPGERTRELELRPGERVAGRGERIGVVYELEDGRTIIVRPGDAPATP